MKSPHHISLRQLRYFVTVAEELHFQRAAQRLNMSQPPLTQRIKEMERDLGVELFRRAGNRVELTDAGRMMLNPAKETLAQADGFCETAQRAARGECGRIKIGLTPTALFFDSIQRAVRAFQEQHPHVALDLTHISSGLALESLRQRKLDVGLLRASPISLPPDCTGIAIAHDRLMLVLPAEHPQTQSKKVPLGAVVDEKFIALSGRPGATLRAQITQLWDRTGFRPCVAQEAANGPTLIALVAAGLGYTILPNSYQAIRFERVVWKAIEADDPWTESSLNVVFRNDTLSQQIPARFIQCLRESPPRT